MAETQYVEPKMDAAEAKVFSESVSYRSCPESTTIIVLVFHKDPRRNSMNRIRSVRGIPLEGYAYDNVNESFCVECVDHLQLGSVPISFQIVMGDWCHYLPMPEAILVNYLSAKQRQQLDEYKAKFDSLHRFSFFQLLQ